MTNADAKSVFTIMQYVFALAAGACVLLAYIYGRRADADKARSEVPQPPVFKMQSRDQLKFLQNSSAVTPEQAKYRRLHTLSIQNNSKVPIFNLEVFAQILEAIVDLHSDAPTGVSIRANDVWDEWYVGAGKTDVRRQELPYTGLWKIGIETLPAGASPQFDLTTSIGPEGDFYKAGMEQPKEIVNEKEICPWLLYGTYQFKRGAEFESVRFAVPIWYDQSKRTMEVLPLVRGGLADGKWLKFLALPGVDFGDYQTFGTMVFHFGTSNDYRSGFGVGEPNEGRSSFGEFSERWAFEKCRRGVQLRAAAGRTNGAAMIELLDKSADELRQALKVFDQTTHPIEYAKTHSDLAATLIEVADRSSGAKMAECFQQAYLSLKACCAVYTRENHPKEWAMNQLSLGRVLRRKSVFSKSNDSLTELDEAIRITMGALRTLTRKDDAKAWANGQLNLGLALGDKAERLSGDDACAVYAQARDASYEALKVYSRDEYPEDWAALQLNLSNQISGQARLLTPELRAIAVSQAIKCANAGLQVFTRRQFPDKWAGGVLTKCNRLMELSDLTGNTGERVHLYRAVVTELNSAAEVRTRENSPKGWASIRNNLGAALKALGAQIGGEEGKSELDRSIEAFEDALTVFKPDQFPEISARISQNLDAARQLRDSL